MRTFLLAVLLPVAIIAMESMPRMSLAQPSRPGRPAGAGRGRVAGPDGSQASSGGGVSTPCPGAGACAGCAAGSPCPGGSGCLGNSACAGAPGFGGPGSKGAAGDDFPCGGGQAGSCGPGAGQAVGAGGCGGGGGGAGGRRPGGPLLNAPIERLRVRLGLTPEQEKALASVRAQYHEKTDTNYEAIAQVRQDMFALWTSGEVPKKEEVLALQGRMRALRIVTSDAMVDARIEALKVLTPTQRQTLGQFGPMSAGGAGGRGGGGGRGMGPRGGRGGPIPGSGPRQ